MTSPLPISTHGAFDPSRSVYVVRESDRRSLDLVTIPGTWLNVHGCRAMGKTTLLFKHEKFLREQGFEVVYVDLAASVGTVKTNRDTFDSAYEWLRRLARAIATEINESEEALLDVLDNLDENSATPMVIEALLHGLSSIYADKPILLILDEYDPIQDFTYCDDLIRSFREVSARTHRTSGQQKISVCFIGWRPLSHLDSSQGANITSFMKTMQIQDFPRIEETFQDLNTAFAQNEQLSSATLHRLLDLSGGQPQLTMTLLEALRYQERTEPDELEEIACRLVPKGHPDALEGLGLFQQIDSKISGWGQEGFEAVQTYLSLIKGSSAARKSNDMGLLLLAGLLRQTKDAIEPKGELVLRAFDEEWADRMLNRLAQGFKQHRGIQRGQKRSRILLINTGGTLGMVERVVNGQKRVEAPHDEIEYKDYFRALESIADVEYYGGLTQRDSINVFPDHWVALASYIHKKIESGFDGIVVAHGTDTMAHTASAVAFALGPHLRFPVVFTGAQVTPDVPHGDAHVNLYRACEVAKSKIPEVVICFGNFVYRAVRAQKKDDRRFDGFESPTYPPLAEITGEINIRQELLRKLPDEARDIELKVHFAGGIRIIPQFPGLEPEPYLKFLEQEDTHGVILQTLGAGNVTNNAPYSFIPFVEKATERGIPVIVTSQYPPDPGSHALYAPAQAPIVAGAIHAGNMTLAAAATKFRWVMGDVLQRPEWKTMESRQKRELVSQLMVEESIVGEFD